MKLIVSAILLMAPFNIAYAQQPTDWPADVEILVRKLTQLHPDPFHSIPKSEFKSKAERVANQIKGLDKTAATLKLMELVATLGDGHTSVIPDYASFRFFPVNVQWFEDGVFVRAIDRKHEHLVGAKLIAVGKVSAEKVVKRFGNILSHDNPWGLRKQIDKQFQTVEFLDYAQALEDDDSATFHFEKDSKRVSIKMQAMEIRDARKIKFVNAYSAGLMKETVFLSLMIKDEQGMPFWNEWLPDQKLIYFKYNRCEDAESFKKLVEGTAGFIKQNEVKKFVLDLRDNAGGSSLVFKPLLEYLLSNDSLNQKGKLFVIVGRNTFSSGIFAACDMRKTNAIFVGEPTGGKPNHFGEVKTFKLPNSGLVVQHSTKHFRLSDGDPDSFAPDTRIRYSPAETFAAHDPRVANNL